MKKKTLDLKKLTLSKETVSVLNGQYKNAVVGGDSGTLCEKCIRPITVTCQNSVCYTFCNIPTCMGISN